MIDTDRPLEVQHDSETVRTDDGTELYVQRWSPMGERRAVLVLSHGFGEHLGCYLPFAHYFAARGAVVYGHDHRGFGRSGGRRGHIAHYRVFVNDLHALVQRARAENPGVPLVLVGHSMGGTIALLFTLRFPELLDRAVYSAPALILANPPALPLRGLALTMSRLHPTYTTTNKPDHTILTRDLELQRATAADVLRHTHISARLYTEMFRRAPQVVFSRAHTLRVPFLAIHGTADRLISSQGSQRLYDLAPAEVRTLRLYQGLRHEVFREIERETVFADVASWLGDNDIALDTHDDGVPGG